MLSGLAGFIYSKRRAVLYVAVIGAVVAGVFGSSVSQHLSPYSATDPATQSVQATNRFQAATGRQIDPGVVALVDVGDARSAAARNRMAQVAAELRRSPDVESVVTYYDARNPAMLSMNGRSTYALAYFKPRSDTQLQNDAQAVEDRFAGQHDVRLGGGAVINAQVSGQVSRDLARSELLAFPFVFLLSLLFFRSLVAAALPALLGGLAIIATFLGLRILSSFMDLSVFALNLTTGLGLGLAIDYSLFMVSRYREESARIGFGVEALKGTLNTAGRTIMFSSATIAVAVASLAIFPQRFLYSMGIAGALVAVLAAFLALVVLPALLSVLGPRVNALAPRWLARAAERDARPDQRGAWYRLARLIERRPATIAAMSTALLIALGLPFTQIKFISIDARVLPASASARQVNDILNSQFPPNRTSPLEVLVGAPAGSPQASVLASRIKALPDVSAVTPPQPAGRSHSLIQVAPILAPLSDATQQLVHRVREIRERFYVGVAGQTASYVDLEQSLGAHLPAVLAVVVAATMVILFLMTGSVLLPIKAVIMNTLGLSAMLGILVLVFQDGNLQGLLSFHSEGALDATQPILLFVIGFGLATDYGVFLLSRIKEARDTGAGNSEAVAIGLERTGRIVTAAALLFAVALGAFSTSSIVVLKELGLGAVLTVLIDASIIRALLVPSLMQLLGPLNWWAPRPLRALHERVGLREVSPPGVASAPLLEGRQFGVARLLATGAVCAIVAFGAASLISAATGAGGSRSPIQAKVPASPSPTRKDPSLAAAFSGGPEALKPSPVARPQPRGQLRSPARSARKPAERHSTGGTASQGASGASSVASSTSSGPSPAGPRPGAPTPAAPSTPDQSASAAPPAPSSSGAPSSGQGTPGPAQGSPSGIGSGTTMVGAGNSGGGSSGSGSSHPSGHHNSGRGSGTTSIG